MSGFINAIALVVGDVVLTLAAIALVLTAFQWVKCQGGMHNWQHTVEWETGRLCEKRCLFCEHKEVAYRCWRCGSAWWSGMFSPKACEACEGRKERA